MKNVCCSLLLAILCSTSAFGQQFKVSYSPAILAKPFTGHVLIYLSKDSKEPKDQDVSQRFPCFSVAVKNVQPGESILLDDKAAAYPVKLSELERGTYYAQVVWDRNLGDRAIGTSAGNLYSAAQPVRFTHDDQAVFALSATKVVPAAADFPETELLKELKAPSALLSKFHHQNMTVDAAVVLPKEYLTEPNRRFPVLFEVSGYGGTARQAASRNQWGTTIDGTPVIKVFLDGKCPLGHSVYANSANNGPWGDALASEFIPALEKRFRCNGARLLWGHSSGGWAVLWLQTHYPKVFTACWSSSPDPVDFRAFVGVNLYKDRNMFYAPDSSLRSMATVAGFFPWLSMKDMYQAEHVLYRGEQLHSFNAVFSAKGRDGSPQELCDSRTGVVDSTVFQHWKDYDISRYLATNWEALRADLDGKVRVSVGKFDNFYLNRAVTLLEARLKEQHAAVQFAYYPADHFTLGTAEYIKEGYAFLNQQYTAWLAKQPATKKK